MSLLAPKKVWIANVKDKNFKRKCFSSSNDWWIQTEHQILCWMKAVLKPLTIPPLQGEHYKS